MPKRLRDFAAGLGLELTREAAETLAAYAELVWQKKDFLNLTSVADKDEIFSRHICDGLAASAFFKRSAQGRADVSAADMGAGAGYIGLTLAAALPGAKVTLVESLQRRCSFLNWAVMKLGLKNVTVKCMRLGQSPAGPFDFVTERAMGQINEVLPLVTPALRAGGLFAAYQSRPDQADDELVSRLGLMPQPPLGYTLPGEEKERWLAVFKK